MAVFRIILLIGLIAVTGYLIYSTVRDIRAKIKQKKCDKDKK